METTARRSGGGLLEGFYRVVMSQNSVYITFVIAGAFLGERVRYAFLRISDMKISLFWGKGNQKNELLDSFWQS
ncbi:Cytochrome b-c1 complex subunit 9 [Quillaja saponaria]|uniref:Complex III subunit 9 n=1 Tax=Quillaja saponaria TaxID=32244 RepID=A0AAD7VD65_QUISA|nr:Cytochrome b-c1 complex subunit 9 [Quillaja saponaria]